MNNRTTLASTAFAESCFAGIAPIQLEGSPSENPQGGGLTTGGKDFDTKLRRRSIDPADLFYAHIGGVDMVARGFLNAAAMIEGGQFAGIVENRYAGWQGELCRAILDGKMSLETLSDGAVAEGVAPRSRSGRQELIENMPGRYI